MLTRTMLSTAAVLLLTTGCFGPRAWVIMRTQEGGVIGYQNRGSIFMDDSEQQRAFDKALDAATTEVCGSRRYTTLWDRYESEQRSYTTTRSVKEESETKFDFSGYARGPVSATGTARTTTTRDVPVTKNYTVSWREMAISCGGQQYEKVPYERTELVRRSAAQAPTSNALNAGSTCTAGDLAEMRAAQLSESAIESACGSGRTKNPDATPATSTLTDNEIVETIGKGAFARCAAEQRRLDGSGGRVLIRFVVAAEGTVTEATIVEKEGGSGTSTTSCWLETAKQVRFPRRAESTEPFRFPIKY